jgi:inosine-uridine nucleoside N-ribohydrolase
VLRLIFDCDPGNGIPGADVDDGIALLMARRAPDVELLAVTVVAGNVPVDAGARVALSLLTAAEDGTTPVFVGCAAPLVQDPRPWRGVLDARGHTEPGPTLWAAGVTLPEPARGPASGHAAQAMVDLVMAHPGELTIVATGPLSNLALALKLEPRLADNVARLVVMGGAFSGPGGLRELNFAYDPEAALIVLASGAPMTLIPLDVTRQTLLTLADNRRLLSSHDPVTQLVGRTAEPWIRWLGAIRGAPGCHLHDPLAMAVAIDPSLVGTESMHLTVELHGALTRGRPTRWLADGRDLASDPERVGGPIDVAQTVEAERFLTLLLDLLN